MNYTSAALGVIGLISLITWITTGRKTFTGPTLDDNSSLRDSTDESKQSVESSEKDEENMRSQV